MTEKKTNLPALFLYILSGLVIVAILAGIVFWKDIKYKLVRQQLNSAISGKSNGLYRLSYKNLVIDEVAGDISVEDVHLSTDSILYEQLNKQANGQLLRMDIRIPKLEITGVKTPKALLTKELEGHSINIQNAVIELSPGKQTGRSSRAGLMDEIYKQVLGNLQRIKADSLLLHNISFIIKDPESGQVKLNGNGLDCSLSDILIDSLHQNDSSRILFAKEAALNCREFSLNSKDKKYRYIFSGLDYSSPDNRLRVAKIRVQPQLSESAFAGAYEYSRDRYDFNVENLEIRNIDRFALFNQRLIADSMILGNSSFKVYRDISHPHDSVDRTDNYPQLELMKLDFPVNIRKLIFVHSFVEYKEKNAKSDSSGKLQFFDVHAVLSNLTNIPELMRKNNRMQLDFRSLFLNQAPVHAKLTMLLNNPDGKFTLDAKMGGMNAVLLNPMIQPMALAEIDKGKIQSLSYHLDADKMHGVGKLTFLYSGIKVILLKKDEAQNVYKTRVLSTLAAGILVKDSNPDKRGTRISRVDYTRDRHRSIFNLMWKSLFAAVKQTAGMK